MPPKDAKKKGAPPPEPIPEPEDPAFLRNLKIIVEQIENINPEYTATDIKVEVKHQDKILGESEKNPVVEKNCYAINWELDVPVSVATIKKMDDLLANPLYFTVWQSPGECEIEVYQAKSETSEESGAPITQESMQDLYEAILGTKETRPSIAVPEVTIASKKGGKDKGGKGGKDDKSSVKTKSAESVKTKTDSKSKSDKSKSSSKTSTKSTEVDVGEPLIVGCCNLDLEPLFLGETEISETLWVFQDKIYTDDLLVTRPNLPRMKVKVIVDPPLLDEGIKCGEAKKKYNRLNFTVECMYNVPEEFPETMEYKLCTYFPVDTKDLQPVLMENGLLKEGIDRTELYKRWYNLSKINNYSRRTKTLLPTDTRTIKNKLGVETTPIDDPEEPLVEWNLLKKCLLNEDGCEEIKRRLLKYRLWLVEIYLTPREDMKGKGTAKSTAKGGKGDKSSSSSATSKGSKGKGKPGGAPMHFMSFVDISSLLHPGMTRTRVISEVRSFQKFEILKETGVATSFFIPPEEEKPEKGGGKDKKPAKAKTPVTPAEPEPSIPVCNERGEPTFIVIEVDLMHPLRAAATLEDLTEVLIRMLPRRPEPLKSVVSLRMATNSYNECIKCLASEINTEYQKFLETTEQPVSDKVALAFIRFLQSNGTYQNYMSTLLKSVTLLVNQRFKFFGDTTKHNKVYESFVSSVYISLLGEMNTVLNGLQSCGIEDCSKVKVIKTVGYLYCATEAENLKAPVLAERYHLETMSEDIRNPESWLNYAIFFMGRQDRDRAFECVKETLALKINHKYGLLLYAVILFERNELYLCETAFLSLLSHYPRFIEGWICLYLYYTRRCNYEGCDVCKEMVAKYSEYRENKDDDVLYNTDGMAWTTAICLENNEFFNTAMLLIKLKALKFADFAIGYENLRENGPHRYYQAVVLYFLEDYEHALMHLADAQKLHGPDFAVNSMIGHCHYQLGNFEDAREAYEYVAYSFDHPDDMHLLYLNLALICERTNELELARKYMLLVVKHNATPYDWLLLGAIFYKEQNYSSAEACLMESNLLDNQLPETWAYLALINKKTNNQWEAEQCYNQMKRHDLRNEELAALVENELAQMD